MSQAKELLELATRLSYFPGAVEQGLAGMLRHLAAAPQPESTQPVGWIVDGRTSDKGDAVLAAKGEQP